MSTADVVAIQTYLKNTSTQVSAAVDACAALDDAARASWYELAGRIVSYVSSSSPELELGRNLRAELNAEIQTLTAKGCGDLAKLIAQAPPPAMAPPPQGTPNPLLGFMAAIRDNPVPTLLLVAALLWTMKGRR